MNVQWRVALDTTFNEIEKNCTAQDKNSCLQDFIEFTLLKEFLDFRFWQLYRVLYWKNSKKKMNSSLWFTQTFGYYSAHQCRPWCMIKSESWDFFHDLQPLSWSLLACSSKELPDKAESLTLLLGWCQIHSRSAQRHTSQLAMDLLAHVSVTKSQAQWLWTIRLEILILIDF